MKKVWTIARNQIYSMHPLPGHESQKSGLREACWCFTPGWALLPAHMCSVAPYHASMSSSRHGSTQVSTPLGRS